jgi:hypothetical protein
MTSGERRAGATFPPDGLDGWWGLVLGLRAGWPAEGLTAEIRREELGAALERAPGWELVEGPGGLWLRSIFRFPIFEAAALFVNFLFASIQMTTYPLAYELTLDDEAEVMVRLSGPTREALTRGVVLFAGVLSNAFFLTRDGPLASDATRGMSAAAWRAGRFCLSPSAEAHLGRRPGAVVPASLSGVHAVRRTGDQARLGVQDTRHRGESSARLHLGGLQELRQLLYESSFHGEAANDLVRGHGWERQRRYRLCPQGPLRRKQSTRCGPPRSDPADWADQRHQFQHEVAELDVGLQLP